MKSFSYFALEFYFFHSLSIFSIVFFIQKTVLAVLNKLINPRWPYLSDSQYDDKQNDDDIQRALESLPDDPMNYDFYYRVLEADENGRCPQIEIATEFDSKGDPISFGWIINENFNQKSVSCLRRIADSENKVSKLVEFWVGS